MDRLSELLDKTPLRIDMLRNTQLQENNFIGQNQAQQKLYKEYWYDKYRNDSSLLVEGLCEKERPDFIKYMNYRCKGSRYKYVFITVSPYTDVKYEEFIIKVKKALSKRFIVSSISCIEWISGECYKDGKHFNGGMHFHSRIEIDGKDPYRVKREFYNTFNRLCAPHCVQVRYSNDENSFIDYINGLEKGKEKECIEISNIYRKKYSVPPSF